ncbi:MAG: hypothetical protein QXW10_01080 [Candidatus Micrarchaeaceae archaeon]
MELAIVRMFSVLAIALIYMLFDLFNNRNVPSAFAYATLAYGAAFSLLYMSMLSIISFAIAAVILGFGYIIYRIGQIGAADIMEFAAISMVMPIQLQPWLTSINQLGLPFIVSVLIGSGIAALVIVPIYYTLLAKSRKKGRILNSVDGRSVLKASLIFGAYVLFIIFAILAIHLTVFALILLLLLAIFSSLIILFENAISRAMIEYVGVEKFEEGDIIALNLMGAKKTKAIKSKVHSFDRLATARLIKELKSKRIRIKFPVYKNAMPLALPIFIGVLLSLAVGDVLLFVFPPFLVLL